LADKAFINELLGTNLFMGAVYILIATGALVAILAFFGCIGAVKEIKCMLLMVCYKPRANSKIKLY
jgi:tetraspanin-11